MAEFDTVAPHAALLLDEDLLGFVRITVGQLDRLPPRPGCRATSTTARNWLTEAGTLYVIDFEWAQLEASVDDLTRLRYGLWNYHPHLQEAFLDGYGRTLTPDDHQVLRACGALRAVWLVVRGHHYGETDLVDANRQTLRRLMDEANDN